MSEECGLVVHTIIIPLYLCNILMEFVFHFLLEMCVLVTTPFDWAVLRHVPSDVALFF